MENFEKLRRKYEKHYPLVPPYCKHEASKLEYDSTMDYETALNIFNEEYNRLSLFYCNQEKWMNLLNIIRRSGKWTSLKNFIQDVGGVHIVNEFFEIHERYPFNILYKVRCFDYFVPRRFLKEEIMVKYKNENFSIRFKDIMQWANSMNLDLKFREDKVHEDDFYIKIQIDDELRVSVVKKW